MQNLANRNRRVMLLTTTTGYQTQAFVEVARKLKLEVVFGTDRCHVLEDPWRDGALPLRFEDAEDSALKIVEYARLNRLDAIVALGDRTTPTAAHACAALGLSHHSPEAADTCRDKYLSRQRLQSAGVSVPVFQRFTIHDDPRAMVGALEGRVGFPCVLKPLALSASRGVIRANDPKEFVTAFERIRTLLQSPEVQVMRERTSDFIQVETYVPGREIAIEGVLVHGKLKVLAIFDKPDPLEGPFFEETIYVTPSRLAAKVQEQTTLTLDHAVQALGLYHGPLHAELRVNSDGVWVLEAAARPIGGLCSRALRFCSPNSSGKISLEELIVRLALNESLETIRREESASGVMMIPIPAEGIYRDADGVEACRATPGVEETYITAKSGQRLTPLPEGASYLGFIFARGCSPGSVEDTLRRAHRELRFILNPVLPIV